MTREQAQRLQKAMTYLMKKFDIADHAVIIADCKPDDDIGDCDIQIVPKSVESVRFDWPKGIKEELEKKQELIDDLISGRYEMP